MEFDLMTLFTELGYDWFSTGHFLDPQNPIPADGLYRQSINKTANQEWIDSFRKSCPNKQIHGASIVSKELVDQFDIVLVSHCCPWPYGVLANWDAIKHKPVIWHTYTQQQPEIEVAMAPLISQGLKVVRGSPKEQNILGSLPMTRVIRPFVNEKDYFGWEGTDNYVLTFNNFFARRSFISNTPQYLQVVSDIPHKTYGGTSDGHPEVIGHLSWEDQRLAYRKAKAYFALGSKPASLTYNMLEAMLTGTPTVTWGPDLGNWRGSKWDGTYEPSDLITNGVHAFFSDNLGELNSILKELLNNRQLAEYISKNGRELVLKEFSKDKVRSDWKEFLESL